MELLIDGVRYTLWTPKYEADLENIVKEHAKDIFGEDSIYFDIKQKIKSPAGIGSIPDGYVINFADTPRWYIVEVELSLHHPYKHITEQMARFINSIGNAASQREIVNAIDERINEDEILKASIKQRIGAIEIHKFLSNLISHPPTLAIIIEEESEQLREVSKFLSHSVETKVVEFRTLEREGVGLAVHAHLFEPLHKPTAIAEAPVIGPTIRVVAPPKGKKKKEEVTIQDLLYAGLAQENQKIFKEYKGKLYEAEILYGGKKGEGRIRLLDDGSEWESLSSPASRIAGTQINGWVWWCTITNGEKVLMDVLRNKYTLLQGK